MGSQRGEISWLSQCRGGVAAGGGLETGSLACQGYVWEAGMLMGSNGTEESASFLLLLF